MGPLVEQQAFLEPIGSILPAEFEQQWLGQQKVSQTHNDERLPELVR
jgi:hypothetical protein